jgi:hypothetical protein
MIGKPKNPVCFSLCKNGKPPIVYHVQKNAWFYRHVTRLWTLHVFWPHYQSKFGDADRILLLDNCPAHNGSQCLCKQWLLRIIISLILLRKTLMLKPKLLIPTTHREAYSLYGGSFVNHNDKTPTIEQLECMVTSCIMVGS